MLGIVEDAGDNEGWAEVEHIVTVLGLKHEHPSHCVGVRLGWMRRMGLVVRHEDRRKTWRLTELGRTVLHGKLTAAQKRALDVADDGQVLALAQAVTGAYRRMAPETAYLMSREWRYGTQRR